MFHCIQVRGESFNIKGELPHADVRPRSPKGEILCLCAWYAIH